LQQQASAGTQNTAAGIQGLAGTANQAFSYKGQMNMLDKEHANEMARLAMLNGSQSEPQGPAPMQGKAMTSIPGTYSPKPSAYLESLDPYKKMQGRGMTQIPGTYSPSGINFPSDITPEQIQMAMQLLGKI
jgi:hypothetical protein